MYGMTAGRQLRGIFFIAMLAYGIDQLTKNLAHSLSNSYIYNYRDPQLLPEIGLALALLILARLLKSRRSVYGAGLFLGGLAGNCTNALTTHAVLDFIPLGSQWKCNCADLMIALGSLILLSDVVRLGRLAYLQRQNAVVGSDLRGLIKSFSNSS